MLHDESTYQGSREEVVELEVVCYPVNCRNFLQVLVTVTQMSKTTVKAGWEDCEGVVGWKENIVLEVRPSNTCKASCYFHPGEELQDQNQHFLACTIFQTFTSLKLSGQITNFANEHCLEPPLFTYLNSNILKTMSQCLFRRKFLEA